MIVKVSTRNTYRPEITQTVPTRREIRVTKLSQPKADVTEAPEATLDSRILARALQIGRPMQCIVQSKTDAARLLFGE